MDKWDFFHKLKGLREPEAVAQTLFLDGIETGQKIGGRFGLQFRTFDPVDIQQLIHKAGKDELFLSWKRWFFRADSETWSTSRQCRTACMSEVGLFFFDGGKQGRSTSPA